jgi:hypothetical protein
MTKLRFAGCLLVVAGLVGGCAVPSPYRPRAPEPQAPPQSAPQPGVQTQGIPTPEPAAPPTPLPPSTTPAPRTHTLTAASKALVAQAQTQLNSGNDALASATIERALRIEPDNPLLWVELARIRQESGNAAQAENLARKALAMATGDGKTQAAAWRIIAQSYRARGRNPEARDADAKASAAE